MNTYMYSILKAFDQTVLVNFYDFLSLYFMNKLNI